MIMIRDNDDNFYGGNKNMIYSFNVTYPRRQYGTAKFEFECFAGDFHRIKRKIEDELKPAVDPFILGYAQNDVISTEKLHDMWTRSELHIKKVIFNNPATIIIWSDGTKTVVKVQNGEEYDPEKGMALCCAKKLLGNKSNFNNEFKKWLPKESESGLADEIIKKCF